jgi:hypothetical protein
VSRDSTSASTGSPGCSNSHLQPPHTHSTLYSHPCTVTLQHHACSVMQVGLLDSMRDRQVQQVLASNNHTVPAHEGCIVKCPTQGRPFASNPPIRILPGPIIHHSSFMPRNAACIQNTHLGWYGNSNCTRAPPSQGSPITSRTVGPGTGAPPLPRPPLPPPRHRLPGRNVVFCCTSTSSTCITHTCKNMGTGGGCMRT